MNLNLCAETGRKRRYLPLKYLLVMKLIFLLTAIACLQVSASTLAQSISLSKTDAPLTDVFNSIKQQSNYKFFWKGDDLSIFKVTVTLKNANITETMDKVLKGLPLTYSITANTIVIRQQETSFLDKIKATFAPPQRIVGHVSGARQESLPGASITLLRTKAATLTDEKGDYVMDGVQPSDTLVVTYIGYERQVIRVGDRLRVDIELKEANNALDQVVVQAYGRTSQRLTTSDIGKVTAADIEKQPVLNVLQAMQGKVAGLDIKQTNGYASAPFKVEIRGRSSISSAITADPLYVIDGVPLTILEIDPTNADHRYQNGSAGLLQNGFGGPAGGQSPFFNLNPADIESIEVLKDADATAIYGSRGANGVILISTKKGTAGKMKFNLNMQEGLTFAGRNWDLLNTRQYLEMRREALRNNGLQIDPVADYDINGTWDTTRSVNWQKVLYGHVGKQTNVQTSATGGTEQVTYRIGAGYDRTTNITTVNGADQRASLSFNILGKSQNKKLTLSLSGNYGYTKSDMVNLGGEITLPPDAPPIYDAQGQLNFAGWTGTNNNTVAGSAYPFGELAQPYVATTNFLTSHFQAGYQLLKGLQFTVDAGYNDAQANQKQIFPISSFLPGSGTLGSSLLGHNTNTNWIIEPQISFHIYVGKGQLSVLAGASEQQTNTNALYLNGSGYVNDDLINTVTAAPKLTANQNNGEYRYNAVFARVTYNWEDEYILNINGRRDGSSRFGPGNQFGNFGSVGAAWIFTEEHWFKDHLSLLSFGKIRASYGTTGSDGVGDYQYLTQYKPVGALSYGGLMPLYPILEANPDFHWQVNTKLEAALNLGFFKDRVNVQVAYYRDRTGNQLIPYVLPTLTGFASVTANSPGLVQNSGMEYTASAKIIDKPSFSWSMSFDLSMNSNKLLAYPDLAQSPYAGQLIVGQSLNIVRVIHATGVDPLTGNNTFEDKNHDGQITNDYPLHRNDDTYVINLNPKFFGGIGTNLRYKALELSMFFNFKKQTGINALANGGAGGVPYQNQSVDILGRWQRPGDVARTEKFSTYGGGDPFFYTNSDGIYTDASYIRLSNLSLAYNFPEHLVHRLGLGKLSVFANANNLFTLTNYRGADPEIQSYRGVPPARTVVCGLSLNF